MKICDDCLEEFSPFHNNQNFCENCEPLYSRLVCVHTWKVFNSRGFNTQDELDKYQIVKVSYENQTGKKLPKIDEKLNKGKK